MGYGVALWRNPGGPYPDCDYLRVGEYPGYAKAVNELAATILRDHPEVDWICCGGDDTYPDPNKTGDEIAGQLIAHFFIHHFDIGATFPIDPCMGTFGVMQPTGDPWADNLGRIIERIAGSPWLGRTWCERANAGKGPLWPEFRHMFVDEHLMQFAQSLGVFLQRPDLTHYHAHAQRIPGKDVSGNAPPAPHMKEWNSQKHWQESKAIFERLKSTNFAECQPIP